VPVAVALVEQDLVLVSALGSAARWQMVYRLVMFAAASAALVDRLAVAGLGLGLGPEPGPGPVTGLDFGPAAGPAGLAALVAADFVDSVGLALGSGQSLHRAGPVAACLARFARSSASVDQGSVPVAGPAAVELEVVVAAARVAAVAAAGAGAAEPVGFAELVAADAAEPVAAAAELAELVEPAAAVAVAASSFVGP
jgi:hypothetical protein